MDDLETIQNILTKISPAKRLKYLRQKITKKNQTAFCQDGIIRSGTLKSVETEKLKISPRIAERLTHKFRLEGVVCSDDIFLDDNSECNIRFDRTQERIIGSSASSLEDIRKKLTTLTPIDIPKDLCPTLFPNGATALARELKPDELHTLKKTLCLVHGEKIFISFLSYENDQIISAINDKVEHFSNNIINFCGLYAIEIVYFNT